MKKVKNFKVLYLILLLGGVSVINSCNNFLDRKSPSVISSEGYWRGPTAAKGGVAAIYDDAQSFFEDNYIRYGDYRTMNIRVYSGAAANKAQIDNNRLTSGSLGTNWSGLYTAIADANNVIYHVSKMSDFQNKNDLVGQAYALRGLFYFYAVRVWGKVPIITKPVNIQKVLNGEVKKRAPVDSVFHDVIMPDLQKAQQLISTNGGSAHMTLGGVLALKAHVYMWPEKYRNYVTAMNAIKKLQGLGRYELVHTQQAWINQFRAGTQNGKSIIFKLAWNYSEDGSNGGVGELSRTDAEKTPTDTIRHLWRTLLPHDFRRGVCFVPKSQIVRRNFNTIDKYAGTKWTKLVNRNTYLNTHGIGWIFYRMAGIILLKAELYNDLDKPSKALSLVQKIRTARGIPKKVDESITNKKKVRNIVLRARQFELYAEGKRFFDLVRNQLAIKRILPPLKDSLQIYWPVSQAVLDRNPALQQTEGY
jgi:hypothetical protein